MKREVFHYTVPPERIAIRPLENREDAKLMLVDCSKGDIQHMRFKDIVGFFSEKDVLLLNNTKVIPARLYGKKTSGGAVEVLLLKKKEEGIWDTLIRGRVKDKTILIFDKISAVVIGKNADGSWAVNFGASDHILFNMGKTVSYTHLTLPTIYSV